MLNLAVLMLNAGLNGLEDISYELNSQVVRLFTAAIVKKSNTLLDYVNFLIFSDILPLSHLNFLLAILFRNIIDSL